MEKFRPFSDLTARSIDQAILTSRSIEAIETATISIHKVSIVAYVLKPRTRHFATSGVSCGHSQKVSDKLSKDHAVGARSTGRAKAGDGTGLARRSESKVGAF